MMLPQRFYSDLEIKVVQLYNLCIRQSTVPLTFALVRSNTGAGAS